jgi:hypothetical protein
MAHAPFQEAVRSRSHVCRACGPDAAKAAESDGWPRDMRVLFRGDFETEPAEDIEASGISAKCRYCFRAPRGKVDALQNRAPRRYGRGCRPGCSIEILQGKSPDAGGSGSAEKGLLRTAGTCHVAGCASTGAHGDRSCLTAGTRRVFNSFLTLRCPRRPFPEGEGSRVQGMVSEMTSTC